jgi:hypothetical protein
MMISVSRTTRGGLNLQARTESENGKTEGDYRGTIYPGESALGFTYEEWAAAVGSQAERRVEVTEDGVMRPVPD